MMLSGEQIGARIAKLRVSCAAVARRCEPPLPGVTVWRIATGLSSGNGVTLERITRALEAIEAQEKQAQEVASGE